MNKIERVFIETILVSPSHRSADPAVVTALAASMKRLGQLQPITVCEERGDDGSYARLIAGHHRVCAARELGWDEIDAIFVTGDEIDLRLREIAENLHRAELTVQERSEQIAEWVRLTDSKVSGQVAQKLEGGRPEGGTSAASRELGLERTQVRRAVKIAKHTTPEAKEAARDAGLDDNQSALLKIAAAAPDKQIETVREITRHRATMAERREPKGSLDYFPTPPFATRALMEVVWPQLGNPPRGMVWEPACGGGHMAEVLAEYFPTVIASDLNHYGGYGKEAVDFLTATRTTAGAEADWIITAPPPHHHGERFVAQALDLARGGVAMFMQANWLDAPGRYENIFSKYPPAIVAKFADRVPLFKGRWEPTGTTDEAHVWIVWCTEQKSTATKLFWIPPGQAKALMRDDDLDRFTDTPVRKKTYRPPPPKGIRPARMQVAS